MRHEKINGSHMKQLFALRARIYLGSARELCYNNAVNAICSAAVSILFREGGSVNDSCQSLFCCAALCAASSLH